jgi:hypothetical protein
LRRLLNRRDLAPARSQPTGELSDIQTTLDNIDADIAGASS